MVLHIKPHFVTAVVLIVLLLALIAVGFWLGWNVEPFITFMEMNSVLGPAVYVFLLTVSIVLVPLSSLPLLPIAANIWGVLLGGALSALGWWLGSVIAFLIARYLGRPALQYFVSLDKLDAWKERHMPRDVTFLAIVLTRMAFPVEIPSYLFGLVYTIRFNVYAIASLLGILPFAFVMVAIGGAIAAREWLLFAGLGGIVAVSTFFLYRLIKRFYSRSLSDTRGNPLDD